MHPHLERLQLMTRRHFLQQSQVGLGAMALASLLERDSAAAPLAANPLAAETAAFPGHRPSGSSTCT